MEETSKNRSFKDDESPCQKLIVAAIDFGSAYSGYAFSFHHEYRSNPLQVNSNNWSSKKSGFMSHKAPTVLLLKPDKTFHSFGYEAEDKYAELMATGQHKEWYYFTGIKMKLMNAMDTFLHNENTKSNRKEELFTEERLTRKMTIKDMEEREMPLIDIMKMVFEYLVNHLLGHLEKRNLISNITPSKDILRVITVPAIWTDASKQFTKEAAIQAGLSVNQVMLAYEPEAAALYCRLLPVDKFVAGGENKELVFSTFERGKKFMVLDLGGGTVDISVQQTTNDGKMKSIHKVCGGAWGGYAVDEEFRKCILKIFGGDVLQDFKEKYRADYLAFYRDFELKKRQAKLNSENRVSIKLPAQLCDLLEERTDCSVEDLLKDSSFKDDIGTRGDKLMISPTTFQSFFAGAMSSIIEHVKNIFKDPRCQNLTGVLLVGGFAESDMVTESLRKSFPDTKFIVPSEAGLSVVKGAVLYGHEPEIICARTCRYTYGTEVARPFNDLIHPLQRRCIISGAYYCDGCFSKTFTIGDLVNIGDKKRIQFTYDFRDENRQRRRYKDLSIDVLITDKEDPQYVDDPAYKCTSLGSVEIPLTKSCWPDYFMCYVDMQIAGTEIEVTCELSTGETEKAMFEFLAE